MNALRKFDLSQLPANVTDAQITAAYLRIKRKRQTARRMEKCCDR